MMPLWNHNSVSNLFWHHCEPMPSILHSEEGGFLILSWYLNCLITILWHILWLSTSCWFVIQCSLSHSLSLMHMHTLTKYHIQKQIYFTVKPSEAVTISVAILLVLDAAIVLSQLYLRSIFDMENRWYLCETTIMFPFILTW